MTNLTQTSGLDQAKTSERRTLRRDAAHNRKRLLEAARIVFAENGLDAGVEEVAQAAGVGVGTLYRRFPTKDALIAELVREFMEEVVALARHAEQVAEGRGLEQFVYSLGEVQAANRGCLARIWTDATSTGLRDEYRVLVAGLLANAKAHGAIRDDASVTDLDLLFWSLRGIIETAGELSAPAWRRQAAICLAGLRPSPHTLAELPIGEEIVAHSRESGPRS